MTAAALEGRTEHESQQYRLDRGHRVAAIQAYRYIARLVETDDDYPLPPGTEDIILTASAAMRDIDDYGLAGAEAYAHERRDAILAASGEVYADTQPRTEAA